MPKRPKARKPNITTPGPLDPWSMPQIQRFAQQQARATINPLLADIDRQQQAAAGNIQGFSTALAGVLAPLGQQVQGAYQNAAGMNDSFGSGFADGLKMLESQAPTAGGNATALGNLLGSLGGITNQAVGTEGAANSTVANAYALAAPNLGNQYLMQSRTQYDKQRADVRSKVPETVQQIISSLLDREIQKDAQRANREALNLDRDKFAEDTRRFDIETDLKRQGLELDWAQLDAQRANWDADRTERARREYEKAVKEGKKERATAIAKRETALSDASGDVLKAIEAFKSGESTVTYWAGSKWVDSVDANGQPVFELDETGSPVIGPDGNPVRKRERQVITKTQTFPNAPITRDDMYKRLKAMYAPTLRSRYKFNNKTIELLIWDALRQSGYDSIYTTAPA